MPSGSDNTQIKIDETGISWDFDRKRMKNTNFVNMQGLNMSDGIIIIKKNIFKFGSGQHQSISSINFGGEFMEV